MKPGNSDLDQLLDRILNKNKKTPKPTKKPPKKKQNNAPTGTINIKRVSNTLPFSCVIELELPEGIDAVYYAALDSKDKRLFYKSELPHRTTLPSFSIHDLPTTEEEIRFVCWPVIKEKIGKPTYYGPLRLKSIPQIGVFDLEVDFKKEADIQLFEQVKPLLEKHYGKAALPGLIKVEEANHDVYLPSSNTIKLSANRRNIIHELVHTCRKQLLFANKKYVFDEETEMIEEFFAEGVSNMIKDELNLSPNQYLKEGAVYGSTMGYNYDFRIQDPCINTQNLQSTCGGILTLENARYFLASEAFHKMALEYFIRTGKYFAKEFNNIYYPYVIETNRDPDKELFFAICARLMPTVERIPTQEWLRKQELFNGTILQGEKMFMDIQDYHTHDEWIGITTINLYKTFENGSDWICGKHKYNQNGQKVRIEIVHEATGTMEYNGVHEIPHYKNGFGSIKLYFNYKKDSPTTLHFWKQDQNSKIASTSIPVQSGLYKIYLTSEHGQQVYYRILGSCMFENRTKIMIANKATTPTNATVKLAHYDKAGKRTWIEDHRFENQLCTIDVPFIADKNCTPGVLQIIYKDGKKEQTFQRNIGYGGDYGGQQFLINTSNKEKVIA